jgi:hypothetical protein
MKSSLLRTFNVFLLSVLFLLAFSLHPYELPLISKSTEQEIQQKIDKKFDNGKYIPNTVWIAVRNSSDVKFAHSVNFIARNPDWKVNFCGNEEKDSFLQEYFKDTSFLWAYETINPVIGTAKAELWRLAILYIYGGVYLDDDADVGVPLSNIVLPTDKFIIAKESYNWTDMCYRDEYLLSNASFNERYGIEKNSHELFDNRFFLNWVMFSSPGNPLLYRIMQHVVNLIKYESLSLTMIKMSPSDHRGKLLMCMSTFPITLAAREMVLEDKQKEIGLRVASEQFAEYQGNMKAFNNDHSPNRWVKQMNKMRLSYLKPSEYAPPNITLLEGRLIQFQGQKDIYLLREEKLRSFPDFQTFLDMKFSLDLVQYFPHKYLSTFTMGDMLPSTAKRMKRTKR